MRLLPDGNRPNDWLVPTLMHQKSLKNSIHQGKVSFLHTTALYNSLTKPAASNDDVMDELELLGVDQRSQTGLNLNLIENLMA